jgi:hypothetical protein
VAALAEEYKGVQRTKAKAAWLEEKERFWKDREQVGSTQNDLKSRT